MPVRAGTGDLRAATARAGKKTSPKSPSPSGRSSSGSSSGPSSGGPSGASAGSRARNQVPFVVRWSGERSAAMPVVLRPDGRGIRYADERAYDRDGQGVLWWRLPSQPGRGRPVFGQVHSLRQRLAMTQLRCQTCGAPADRNGAGVLWIIDASAGELRPGREDTAHPPVCRPCARGSVTACPHLRAAFTAVRVRAFVPYGVEGVRYVPTPEGPEPTEMATFPFHHPGLPYVRAHQLVMRLRDFTPIDLDDPAA